MSAPPGAIVIARGLGGSAGASYWDFTGGDLISGATFQKRPAVQDGAGDRVPETFPNDAPAPSNGWLVDPGLRVLPKGQMTMGDFVTFVEINGGSPSPPATTFGGDLTGVSGFQTVIRIQGVALSPTKPTDGQALVYSAVSGQWQPGTVGSFVAAGDLGGSPTSQTVVGLRGRALPLSLSPGFLQWTGSAFAWSAPYTAAGDLSGSSSSQTVVGLKGSALPALTTGFLQWTGSAWAFGTPFAAAGDLSGSSSSQQVTGLKGSALPALTTGYLQWNGSAWQFNTPGGGFSAGGDLNGTSTSQNVIGVLGAPLPLLSTGYLRWNGSNWVFTNPSTTLSGDCNGTVGGSNQVNSLHASVSTGIAFTADHYMAIQVNGISYWIPMMAIGS